MDAAGAGQLRETDDAGFHVLAALQHEVSELVDDDGDIGHGLEIREIRRKFPLKGREPLVVARNVLGVEPRHARVALVHLVHGPVEGVLGVLHFLDNGMNEMALVLIHPHFHALRVDEKKLEFIRGLLEEKARQHGVEAHGLALTRGAGHKEVRHFREIRDVWPARRVLADDERQGHFAARLAEGLGGGYLAEIDDLAVVVGDDDTDRIRAGHGSLHEDRNGHERAGNVVSVAVEDAHGNAARRAHHIRGHHGSRCRMHEFGLNIEIPETAHERLTALGDVLGVRGSGRLRLAQKLQRRKFVAFRLCLLLRRLRFLCRRLDAGGLEKRTGLGLRLREGNRFGFRSRSRLQNGLNGFFRFCFRFWLRFGLQPGSGRRFRAETHGGLCRSGAGFFIFILSVIGRKSCLRMKLGVLLGEGAVHGNAAVIRRERNVLVVNTQAFPARFARRLFPCRRILV